MLVIHKKKPKVAHQDDKQVETLESTLALYDQQEFIPSHIIPQLIQCTFPTSTVVHTYSQHHHIIKVPIRELLQAPITNWQFNRPADKMRCEDIARYMVISKKPIDTQLFLSFNNKKRTFDIVDGIHRYTALTIVKEKTAHLDFISENEYGGDMTWLWNSFIFLNIRINTPEGELIELFKSLNKSNPIPELFVDKSLSNSNVGITKDKRIISGFIVSLKMVSLTHFSLTFLLLKTLI